jgi:hypothetical protein
MQRYLKKIYLTLYQKFLEFIYYLNFILSGVSVSIHRKYVHIRFKRFGKQYQLFLPVSPTLKTKHQVVMITKNNKIVDITHPFGIPYFLTAEDMDAQKLVFIDHNGDMRDLHGEFRTN